MNPLTESEREWVEFIRKWTDGFSPSVKIIDRLLALMAASK